jgi:hypothetical protein
MTEGQLFAWAMLAWVAMMIVTLLAAALQMMVAPTRDRDRSGEADETAQQAQPEARARAGGIAP